MDLPAISRKGLSLPELLISLGVIAVLIGAFLPAVATTRDTARGLDGAARTREMAIGVRMYADLHRGFPPVYAEPAWPPRGPFEFDFGRVGGGNWFEHSYLSSYGISAVLGNTDVVVMPGNRTPPRVMTHGGVAVRRGDFALTKTLYADPEFFDWTTMRGPSQFRPQRMDSVVYPSDKGLIHPFRLHHLNNAASVPVCCLFDVPAPLAYFDLSVRQVIFSQLRPGIVNLFDNTMVMPGADPSRLRGPPVQNTVAGLRGRDNP